MNANEVRLYLHKFDNLKKEVESLQEALRVYKIMDISGIKAQVITDMPMCHSNTSKTELMATTRLDYIQDLEGEIDSKLRLMRAINSVYFYLNEPKRSIIEMRYFIQEQGKRKANWKEIANECERIGMPVSEENCRKIDCRIINRILIKYIELAGEKCHKNTTDILKSA